MTIRKEACLAFSGFWEMGGKQDKEESAVCMGIGTPDGLEIPDPEMKSRKKLCSWMNRPKESLGFVFPSNKVSCCQKAEESISFRQ